MYRLCPYCTAAAGRLIDPGCLVCLGGGTIRLGAAALSIYEPDVVAEAIAIALADASAAEADDPGSMIAALDSLADAGIIHRPTTPQEQALTTTEAPTTAPAWVDEWHHDNPAASAAGDTPEATPETIELEAGTATIRTYWQDGELGHHLDLPDTGVQLLTSSDLQALAAALQELAAEA